MGGDMFNNVVGAILRACLDAGHAALRFNFRGVGASTGAYDGGNGEADDVRAAIDYLRSLPEIDAERVALAGYSFGAMVALRVASGRDDLSTVIAVSNPTKRGSKVEIHLPMPALFLAGDRDEYCDGDLLTEYGDEIGPNVTVTVFPGVDHFWWGSDDRLVEATATFLRGLLP
jgi:hypothetical protein